MASLKPRRCQNDLMHFADDVIAGGRSRNIGVECTPGGGKSAVLPILLNRLIPAELVEFGAWLVPRISLADQGEADFRDSRKSFFNPHGYEIRIATNDWNPCRGLAGFVTTHQAATVDASRTIYQEFIRRPGILVVDECQHVKDSSSLHEQLLPTWNAAKIRVAMGGRFERYDRKRIALLPYQVQGTRHLSVDWDDPEWQFIRYSRQDALAEQAKVPFCVAHLDGFVQWLDAAGELDEIESLREIDEDSPGLWAALRTEYAEGLLAASMEHFIPFRRYTFCNAKLLVVVYTIKEAHRLRKWLRDRYPELRIGIAVSQDSDTLDSSKDARDQIRRFKERHDQHHALDVLITVQMAYEGLDVPSITHIACLTHIRSWTWIEQMLDRGTRFDRDPLAPDWKGQRLRLWTPDDPKMNAILGRLHREQGDFAIRGPEEPIPGPPGPGGKVNGPTPPQPPEGSDVIPVDGYVTSTRYTGELGTDAPEVDSDQARYIAEILNRMGMTGTPQDFLAAMRLFEANKDNIPDSPNPGFQLNPIGPSQEETRYRTAIEKRCRDVDAARYGAVANGTRWGTTSGIIKAKFQKGREDMTIPELRQVWAWLNKEYPIVPMEEPS
jgi:hypothetical protein